MKRGKQVISGLILLFSITYILFKGILPGWNNESTDFNNYYVASKLVAQGEPVHQFYDNVWFNDRAIALGVENGAKFAPFTPVTAYLYLPLTFWDLLTAKRIWLVFNLLLLFIIPFRLRHYFDWHLIDTLLILSLFFAPLASNLNFGQAYFLISWLLMEVIGLNLTKNKSVTAGVIIGLLASIKFIPILFLAYIRRKNRFSIHALIAVLGTISIVMTLLIISDLEVVKSYLSVFSNHIQGDLSGQGKFAIGFQSIDSLLNNLFLVNPETNTAILTHNPEFARILKILLMTGVLTFCLIIFKQDKFKFNPINSSIFIFGAFTLLPASASYHFLFLMLPACFIIAWLREFKLQIFLVGFIFILIATFSIQYHHIPEIQNFKVLNLLIHYPRFWTLLLLFVYLSYVKMTAVGIESPNSNN